MMLFLLFIPPSYAAECFCPCERNHNKTLAFSDSAYPKAYSFTKGKEFKVIGKIEEGESVTDEDGGFYGAMVEYIDLLAELGGFRVEWYDLFEEKMLAYINSSEYPKEFSPTAEDEAFEYACDSGKFDFIGYARRLKSGENFPRLDPPLYADNKPLYIVDHPLGQHRNRVDLFSMFNVFEMDLWIGIGVAVVLVITISAVFEYSYSRRSILLILPETALNYYANLSLKRLGHGYKSQQASAISFTFGLVLVIVVSLFTKLLLTSIAIEQGYKPPFDSLEGMKREGFRFLTSSESRTEEFQRLINRDEDKNWRLDDFLVKV